ncbi:ATP cone domain-containing protein [Sphingobacterium sp. FBM7-1]|uniref:ATP cone domain-containing protein n=1 Tax=Sphingobacterium sp. FBM7-1 TaxID=2886688 RepID=UPI001D10B6E3|nr:ATP cone domain-containing protein [Sphingobacterium sp. FBM7-1]MCC2598127.1 restriction endonuclease [Sphingobacterium sp. FBM7-1]
MKIQVKKHSGELVPFEPKKLRHSLSKSEASEEEVDKVFERIQPRLYNGITTRELYELAFDLLKNHRDSYAARYSLKKALRDLGPEGFYFEKWIGKLFANAGYQTITGKTVQGHAVTHEIDVIATKNEMMLAIECKFRNDVDAKISVTTPMYFISRVKDIKGLSFSFFETPQEFTDGWLVTNAYLTSDSIRFGEYYNLNMLAWDYPPQNNIKNQVDNLALYPVTCLTNLNGMEKSTLLKNGCILVKDLVENPEYLAYIQTAKHQKKRVLIEAQELIHSLVDEEL